MEAKLSDSCVNLLLNNLCFCFHQVSGFILRLSFSYKSHLIKTIFTIFDKFTIFLAFKIKELKYMKTFDI